MEYKATSISHMIPCPSGHQIHVEEIHGTEDTGQTRQNLLFIHGAIENGQMFYSKKLQGLAPFLANKGFRCFVMDLRGRGQSIPRLSPQSDFGQLETLTEDLPVVIKFIQEQTGHKKFSFITHSWGGVLANSFLLENPEYYQNCGPNVHVSTKRRVSVLNLHRFFYIDLMWLMTATLIVKLKGFLPPGYFGPDGESKGTLKDSQKWVYSRDWKDDRRGVDYKELAKKVALPPTLYLTGSADFCLGHIKDVTLFALESGHSNEDILLLGKNHGNKEDYDHINILTSKKAPLDHFPIIADFLESFQENI